MPYLLLLKSHWKLALGALLLIAVLVQTVRLERAERRADRLQFENNEMRVAIDEAHRATLEAQKLIDRIMREGRAKRDRADGEAKRVENAPLPGNCKTPPAILELDI